MPDLDHDLCNDTDDDDEQLWWDDYVSVFPAQYYTLLTPEDYDVLFNEDSLDPILNDDEEEFSFPSYTTAEASQPTTDASLTLLSKPINCPMDDEQFNTLQDIEDQTPINLIRGTRLPFIYTTRKFATCLNYHAIRRTYAYDHAIRRTCAYNHATYHWKLKEDLRKKRLTPNYSCALAKRQRGLREKG